MSDNDMKDWPYLDDEQDAQLTADVPPSTRWYEDDRDCRLERMQDRLDTHVAAMVSSSQYASTSTERLIDMALDVIREIDAAAQQEVDRDD